MLLIVVSVSIKILFSLETALKKGMNHLNELSKKSYPTTCYFIKYDILIQIKSFKC